MNYEEKKNYIREEGAKYHRNIMELSWFSQKI